MVLLKRAVCAPLVIHQNKTVDGRSDSEVQHVMVPKEAMAATGASGVEKGGVEGAQGVLAMAARRAARVVALVVLVVEGCEVDTAADPTVREALVEGKEAL